MKAIFLALILFSGAANADCLNFFYRATWPTSTENLTTMCKAGYAVGFSSQKRTPAYVAEKLTPGTAFTIPRSGSFHSDSDLPLYAQANEADYAGSGYDKGHMMPYEDASFSEAAALDSFSFANAVPQNPENNRGPWRALEMKVRNASKVSVLYVMTGPITCDRKTIGKGISVPCSIFKIIVNATRGTITVYALPNAPVNTAELDRYQTTLAVVQAKTQINFKLDGLVPAPL